MPADKLVCDESKSYNSEDTCYPLENSSATDWSLVEIFGRSIPGSCPLIDDNSNDICIKVPSDWKVLFPPEISEIPQSGGYFRCYSIAEDIPFDLNLPLEQPSTQVPLQQPILYAERTIIGHGQERGGLRSILTNPSNSDSVDFVYFETLPWFMRPYIHSLQTKVTDRKGVTTDATPIVKDIYYRPAVDRYRGTQLELILSVPPASTVTLTYQFEKAILRYTEYPPDANRGFNVAPAVIRVLGGKKEDGQIKKWYTPIYIRTTSLLLPLPTPDFSMPYNVIILTSTVIALAFGSIFNLLVRRFVAVDELPTSGIKSRIVGKFVTLKDRLSGSKTAKVE